MCIFCEIAKGNIPSYKVYEDEYTIAFLDLSQVSRGHCLVIPKKHAENLLECEKDTLNHIMKTISIVSNLLKKKLQFDGFNLLNNCGEYAGQSVMHLHFHLIPRYKNDNLSNLFNPTNTNPDKQTLEKTLEVILK